MIFQNSPNTTRRFVARGILDNFEISLVVLLPNTTTSHAFTYTYHKPIKYMGFTNQAVFDIKAMKAKHKSIFNWSYRCCGNLLCHISACSLFTNYLAFM